MRFADLQTFVDVVEAGGMTQAAAVRGVSQPGLSRTIRDLETRLQAPLLRRTGRGVELTQAGAEFLTFARNSLAAMEDAQRRIRELSGALPDRLRIAIPPRLGVAVFPELYRRFMLELPEVAVAATEALTADMADGMNTGRYDLLVSYLPSVPGAGPGRAAFRESLYLVEGRGAAAVSDAPVRLSDIAKSPVLLNRQTSPYRRLIDGIFADAGCKLTVSREIETAEGLLAFATEGEGATILPYSNFHAEAARGEVQGRVIVEPAIERQIFIHAGRHLEPRAAGLAGDIILTCLKGVAERFRWFPVGRKTAG